MTGLKHRVFLLIFSLALLSSWTAPAVSLGQEWVRDMFTAKEHDFGTVPRGAKAEFEFKLQNKYQENVHIASVRSSCGCTTPRVKDNKTDLKTYEEGTIVCEFNTQSFVGPKSAVVTVVFTQPFYGEMQLNVKGNIRSDIVTEPGLIEFGEVEVKQEKQAQVKVAYNGNQPWEIVDIRCVNDNLKATMDPVNNNGRPGYIINIRLLDSAPAGDFNEQIVLVTNEPKFNLVTIPVSGTIMPPLRLPVSVELGSLRVGSKAQGRMVVRGKEEFEVTEVTSSDDRFTFTIPKGKRKVHVIPFEFTTGDTEEAFRQKVTVKTSLGEGNSGSTVIGGNIIK
ncbi:MAG: DUF1573 domain-containing protein [Pirellulaceae bacterium]